MAPTFHNYAGTEAKSQDFHYSQAVRVGNTVKCSGQGGWYESGEIEPNLEKQVALALENVERALKAVDERLSWANVYAIRSYHIDIDASADFVIEGFKKHMPNHRPVFTCVQISKLGIEGMQVEIEVEALLE